MTPVGIERSNTVLYCTAWRETIAFYRDVIGLPVVTDIGWFVEFRLTETSFLSVADASRTSIEAVAGRGITITWQVADVAEARTALTRRGVPVTPVAERWGSQVCYCHDPEGHRLELWSAFG